MILGLCERFGCLPSQLLAEDADLLRLVHIEGLGRPPDKNTPGT
jgi:hypothetical protein